MSYFLKYNVLHHSVEIQLINIFMLLDCLYPQEDAIPKKDFMMPFPRNNDKSKSDV